MTKQSTALLLLLLTLVPTLVVGRPLYHCGLTGALAFECPCEAVPAGRSEDAEPVRSCCSTRNEAAPPIVPVDRCGDDGEGQDCCDVTVLQWTLAEAPRQELGGDALALAPALDAVLHASAGLRDALRATNALAPPRPPLFILNSSYRC